MGRSANQVVREKLIAAMEQRAARFDGEARRVLDERVAVLRALAADDASDAEEPPDNTMSPSGGPLGKLVGTIASVTSPERAAYPELPALEAFRTLWSGIRSDSQLQQSVAQAPTGAGPLNSAALVSRSIALMREVSPEYLRSFLGYVDDLAWLEQLSGASVLTASGAVATKKRVRSKRLS